MIRFYCDWCTKETKNPHGGEFGRRVSVQRPNHVERMNVLFNLEFHSDKPQHLCRNCYISKIQEAVNSLSKEQESDA